MSYLALFGSQVHYHKVAAPYGQVILLWLLEQPDRRTGDAEQARQELKLDPVQFAMGLEWCQRELHVSVYDSDYDGKTNISMVDMGSLEYKPLSEAFKMPSWMGSDSSDEDEAGAADSAERSPFSIGSRYEKPFGRWSSFGTRSRYGSSHRRPYGHRSSSRFEPGRRNRFGSHSRLFDDELDEIKIMYDASERWLIALMGALVVVLLVAVPAALDNDPTLEADAAMIFVTLLVVILVFAVGFGLTWLTLLARERWRKNHAKGATK